MNDILVILLYEFINISKPFWIGLIYLILRFIKIKYNEYIHFNSNKNIELQKVLIIFNNRPIFLNILNINYYKICYIDNGKIFRIMGNKNFYILNYKIIQFNKINNCLDSNSLKIYLLPIKKYSLETCLICFEREGQLIGLCGHQNICKICINSLNKCPLCNDKMLFSNLDIIPFNDLIL